MWHLEPLHFRSTPGSRTSRDSPARSLPTFVSKGAVLPRLSSFVPLCASKDLKVGSGWAYARLGRCQPNNPAVKSTPMCLRAGGICQLSRCPRRMDSCRRRLEWRWNRGSRLVGGKDRASSGLKRESLDWHCVGLEAFGIFAPPKIITSDYYG